MKKLKNYLAVGVGLAALVALVVLTDPPAAQSVAPLPVSVTNTPNVHVNNSAIPVSQSGSWHVGVNNFPASLPVTQSGTWNVGLTGSPTVTVGNPSNNPVLIKDILNPAINAFQSKATVLIFGGNTSASGSPLDTQASGTRWVIETVAVNCSIPAGQKILYTSVTTWQSEISSIHYDYHIPVSFQGGDGASDYFSGNAATRLYSDVSQGAVGLNFARSDSTGSGGCTFGVSGYTVPAP